jgi:hypothetical protein
MAEVSNCANCRTRAPGNGGMRRKFSRGATAGWTESTRTGDLSSSRFIARELPLLINAVDRELEITLIPSRALLPYRSTASSQARFVSVH